MINLQNNTNNNEKDITIVCWFPGFKGEQFIRKLTNTEVIPDKYNKRYVDLVKFKKFAETSNLSIQELKKYYPFPVNKIPFKSFCINDLGIIDEKPIYEYYNGDLKKTKEHIINSIDVPIIVSHKPDRMYNMFPNANYIVIYGETIDEVLFGCSRYITYAIPSAHVFAQRHLYKSEIDLTNDTLIDENNRCIELEKHMKWVTGVDDWFLKKYKKILSLDLFEFGFNRRIIGAMEHYYDQYHPQKKMPNTEYITLNDLHKWKY